MQHILITGGNAGIGKATAIALVAKGHKVIIAGRDSIKVENAVNDIENITGRNAIAGICCDLSNFDSILNCVQTFRSQYGKLDTLINNAGVVTNRLQFTNEGFELQIGVNHLGHFLLTSQLLELLASSSGPRIINVSSNAHYRGEIDFSSFRGETGSENFKGMKAYSQSKLANVLFTKELARRYPKIVSHSLSPGVVRTNIASKNGNSLFWRVMWTVFKPFMLTPEKGARTSLFLTQSDEAAKRNGCYFYKQKEVQPSKLACELKLAKELWEVSEKLVNRVDS